MARKIYRGVQNILFAIAIFLIIGAIACFAMHIKPCVVVSGSMEPKIMTGSLCFIQEKNKVPSNGDIIAFEKGEITVVHRVINKTNEGYITKGDNNDVADPGVLNSNRIKGFYLFSIPQIGYIVTSLQTLSGIIIFITLLLTFIIVGMLLENKENKARKE